MSISLRDYTCNPHLLHTQQMNTDRTTNPLGPRRPKPHSVELICCILITFNLLICTRTCFKLKSQRCKNLLLIPFKGPKIYFLSQLLSMSDEIEHKHTFYMPKLEQLGLFHMTNYPCFSFFSVFCWVVWSGRESVGETWCWYFWAPIRS